MKNVRTYFYNFTRNGVGILYTKDCGLNNNHLKRVLSDLGNSCRKIVTGKKGT